MSYVSTEFQIVAHHHEYINNGSCWVMSHHFQELGRLQRSSCHTQSPSSPGLTCFRHSDCSGSAAGLILTHLIRLYN